MGRGTYIAFLLLLFIIGFIGCVETFQAETQSFENALVIDALLTDEEKQHSVILTRAYRFEDEGPVTERNAQVQIIDDLGNTFAFEEEAPGQYVSTASFRANAGVSYTLMVGTSDGSSYRSEKVTAPGNVPITELSAVRQINDLGEEGVGILLANSSSGGETTYFRYEYEETFKIIAPKYDPFEFEIIDYTPCDGDFYEVGIKPRIEEQRVCYGSAKSIGLIQTSTQGLKSSEVVNFNTRFIGRDDYIMSHRYSILVRQYAQTQDAFSYYEQLGDFSSSDNIFSQIQPGFLAGNMSSESDKDEKVLGYFEVASVSTERAYFNYADLFPGEPLPPYPVNCETAGNPLLVGPGYHCDDEGNCDGDCESPLIEAILAGTVVYLSPNTVLTGELAGPYFTLPSPCGDCTKLGSNVIPEFWEE